MLTLEVTRSLPGGWQSIDTMEKALDWIDEREEEGAVFSITLLSTKEIVGILFLTEIVTPESEHSELRLGYLLSERCWGKGLGTELIEGLVKWSTVDGKIGMISTGIEVNNVASIKLLKKNGFIESGREGSDNGMVTLERTFI